MWNSAIDNQPTFLVAKRTRRSSGELANPRGISRRNVEICAVFLKGRLNTLLERSCPMMFELLLDVMDRTCEIRTLLSVFGFEVSSLQSSNRWAHLRESHRALRDGSFGVPLSQALRARLRSHRPSGTFRNRLCPGLPRLGKGEVGCFTDRS
jgi:hypothetical protein